jgi:hypothetical protein
MARIAEGASRSDSWLSKYHVRGVGGAQITQDLSDF